MAIFQTTRFFVLGAGTSIFPADLLLVLPLGTMLIKRSFRGLSGLLALQANIAELEQTMALTPSNPARSSTRT